MTLFDDLQGQSEEELLRMIDSAGDRHPVAVTVRRILEARNAEKQLQISNALVRAAESQAQAAAQQAAAAQQMVAHTQALANFTRALARATWALFFVGGATVVLTIVQIILVVMR
jgi:hypothetical protein